MDRVSCLGGCLPSRTCDCGSIAGKPATASLPSRFRPGKLPAAGFFRACYHRPVPWIGGSSPIRPAERSMAAIGRVAQFLGLAIPAAAIVLELQRAISLGQMLMMLVAAVCCFWIGRILEGYSRQ
jgi:hypothetical protein